jgi:LmbE family N-acetylglucosaminyl deacetylase
MKLPPSILFVGAHCDDIELFAGGLLAQACRTGRRVGLLTFSDHRGVLSEAQAAGARAEMHANVEHLRTATGATVEDHTERMLSACSGEMQAERGYLYARMEALRPHYELVVTHSASDTNQDHQQVASEAARVFKAHCTLWGGEFPSNDLGEFEARVYVPLACEDADTKVALVQRYRSQQINGRPYFDEAMVRGLAAVRGAQIRVAAAEAFSVVRLRVS